MLIALLIWAYASPMLFVWCRVFFALRGRQGLGRRWLLASAIALAWPLYGIQFVVWRRSAKPLDVTPVGDVIETEFRQLYP